MYMPSIFGESLFDNMFPFDEKFFTEKKDPLYGKNASRMMKTDVRETADAYEMKVELPGFKKENVKISLENGYLTIYAEKNSEEEKGGRFIRRERYCGACQRSFYVGDEIHEDQIRAEFRHGILKIDLPKKKDVPAVEETKYISIE